MPHDTDNVIPVQFVRIDRCKENMKALDNFFMSESVDFHSMAGGPLPIYGTETIDLTVDKSLRQDLELLFMDFLERCLDRIVREDA